MTEPYYQDDWATIYHGDCREIACGLTADLVVTDGPYSLSVSADHENRPGKRDEASQLLRR